MNNETLVRNALEALEGGGRPQPLLDLMLDSASWLFPDMSEVALLVGKAMIRDYLLQMRLGKPDGPSFWISHVEDFDDFVIAEVVQHFRPTRAAHHTEYWTYAIEVADRRVVEIRAYKEPED